MAKKNPPKTGSNPTKTGSNPTKSVAQAARKQGMPDKLEVGGITYTRTNLNGNVAYKRPGAMYTNVPVIDTGVSQQAEKERASKAADYTRTKPSATGRMSGGKAKPAGKMSGGKAKPAGKMSGGKAKPAGKMSGGKAKPAGKMSGGKAKPAGKMSGGKAPKKKC